MPHYPNLYKGTVVFLKCAGGEIVAAYQKPGSPPPPEIVRLELEDPDIPPLPEDQLARTKSELFVSNDFIASSLHPLSRVRPLREFVRGRDLETGMNCHIERRIRWVRA